MSVFMKHRKIIVPALFLAVLSATVITTLSVKKGVVEDILVKDYSSILPIFIVFYIVAIVLNTMYLLKLRQFKLSGAVTIVITGVILWLTPLLVLSLQ